MVSQTAQPHKKKRANDPVITGILILPVGRRKRTTSLTKENREVEGADLLSKTPDKSEVMSTSPTIEKIGDEQYHQANTTGAAAENALMMSNVTTPPPRPEQVEDRIAPNIA